MREWSASRRTLLRTGGALGAATLAGCLGGDTAGGDASPVDGVPADAKLVVHADVAALLADEQLRTRLKHLLDRAAQMYGLGATSLEAALDEIESTVGLDPRDLERATLFAGWQVDSPIGVFLQATWEESALRDAMAFGTEPETATYNDRTVYRYGDETALGVIEDGTYVLGTAAGVEGAIDVAAGDAEAVCGRLREGFEAAPSGPFRVAVEAPPYFREGSPGTRPVDRTAFLAVTHAYGGYTVEGDERPGSATIVTDSASAAGGVADELRTARDAARENLEDTTADPELVAEYDAMLASVEIETDGPRVTVTFDQGEVLPVVLLEVLAWFTLSLGGQQQSVAPTADFDFEYDAGAGELTIVHSGGDYVPTAELFVRGRALGATGNWADLEGRVRSELNDEPIVVAGDDLTVTVDPDYVARVIWESSDGTVSSELAIDRGPEA